MYHLLPPLNELNDVEAAKEECCCPKQEVATEVQLDVVVVMVQFPTLLSESGLPESDTRTILSKMNELLRFLQKHQSELFNATYRKPEGKELKKRIPRKMKKDKAIESGAEGLGETTSSPRSSDNDGKKRNFANVSSVADLDLSPASKKVKA